MFSKHLGNLYLIQMTSNHNIIQFTFNANCRFAIVTHLIIFLLACSQAHIMELNSLHLVVS